MKKSCLAILLICLPALADEGMWLFNQFPKEKVRSRYSVDVTDDLLKQLQLASVRVGASASFVSPDGLIFTNHHVVLGCVQQVSSKEHNYVADGFEAKSLDAELKCPGQEANVLLKIEDVTAKVKAEVTAAAGTAQANSQRRAALTKLETECSSTTGHNCQTVTLYGGATFHLYEYKKYSDIRLVFAPEYQMGFFGGDPDNFTYPRFCLDIGFMRAYENGKPAQTPNYLRFSPDGAKNNQAVFVSGHPGRTERLLTVAEFEHYRDVTYPYQLERLEATIRTVKSYMAESPENARVATRTLFGLENTYKAMKGRFEGLKNPKLLAAKKADEKKLRDAVAADSTRKTRFENTWDDIAKAIEKGKSQFVRRSLIDSGPQGMELFTIARTIVRLPVEKAKPAGERLREYAGPGLVSLEHRLYAQSPITKSLETVLLANYFEALIKLLGADDPTVMSVLQGKNAKQAAEYYVANTKLIDVAERKRLAESVDAIRDSEDTMVMLARTLDPEARRLRKQYEDSTEAVLSSAKPMLAEARFAVYGAGEAPDATGTLRLSFGQVKGYKKVQWSTQFAGLYGRATGKDPYILPKKWIDAKTRLDLKTPFDFVTTADIIGGNSGSPTVNAKGEIIGIVFDGNLEGLASHFQFTEVDARAVHVSSQAILEALHKVYDAKRLLEELGIKAPPIGD